MSLLFDTLPQPVLVEKAMATHSSVLAWRIPETVGPHLWGHTELDTTEAA